ncbi:unnamed protein product [Brassica rapa]|uniref:F-box domain-containing protein n=2 Tax=Brassica TaxID=3705 RepID=A0A3P6CKU3_BRACM|nr:unnamed protein product [Brassica napus]CAG7907605.1 unnamed protein product [Brassica rapa]VDD14348.1 unnamed protein product [Brassica rapa]
MKSRRRNVPEGHNTIVDQCHSRTCTEEYSETIPHDLIIEIVSRLPTKSVARCRCVSKLWSSLLVHPYFTETYLTRSSASPKILFACVKDGKVSFYTSPQPDDDKASSPITAAAATYHMNFPFDHVIDIYRPMSGLVCIRDGRILKGRKTAAMVWEICNPSTGQSVILPKMKSRKRTGAKSFFGYDPIEKQFKVLSMFTDNDFSSEHQVLTLSTTGKLSVRIVECGIPHCPLSDGICISGVLYYKSSTEKRVRGIMCFDVRSETFRFVKVMEPFIGAVHPQTTLVNYKGKLASVMSGWSYNFIGETCTSFVMYVVQDLEKQEWSKHNYKFAPGLIDGFFAGVTVAGELVLSPKFPSSPFYVFYCSLERKSIRRVEIQGMGGFKQVYTFVNHVEDVKLMRTV